MPPPDDTPIIKSTPVISPRPEEEESVTRQAGKPAGLRGLADWSVRGASGAGDGGARPRMQTEADWRELVSWTELDGRPTRPIAPYGSLTRISRFMGHKGVRAAAGLRFTSDTQFRPALADPRDYLARSRSQLPACGLDGPISDVNSDSATSALAKAQRSVGMGATRALNWVMRAFLPVLDVHTISGTPKKDPGARVRRPAASSSGVP
ncbi:hypothetical protein HPB47_022817 [Ixodes persulcatus]|uniref:Uncharacterized protein n=1 Tax=Ixodes persulcatus TaxID=34615 RepID=A0AC60QAX3_IXOPE|nr:hypothetical protein HPB47_022817 [Ixodes persulcatus]